VALLLGHLYPHAGENNLSYLLLAIFALFLYWHIEYRFYLKKLKQIPIRIHVNGTRGKTTVTRMIASGLRKGGLKVIAKTTGTIPSLILEDGRELFIFRRGRTNIKEQCRIVSQASKKSADAVILECMAIKPELQWISEHRLIQSTIGVITNIRLDHLEDLEKPRIEDVAHSLKMTIPLRGKLVTSDKKFLPFLISEARKVGTEVIFADPSEVPDELVQITPHMNFRENIATALKVCTLLGVEKKTALQGIREVKLDPGALRIFKTLMEGKIVYFVNLFAVNDLSSLRIVWSRLKESDLIREIPAIAILNIRQDRMLRCVQFAKVLATELDFYKVILTGSPTYPIKKILAKKYSPQDIISIKTEEELAKAIIDFSFREIAIYGLGNTQGMGLQLIDYFEKRGKEIWLHNQ